MKKSSSTVLSMRKFISKLTLSSLTIAAVILSPVANASCEQNNNCYCTLTSTGTCEQTGTEGYTECCTDGFSCCRQNSCNCSVSTTSTTATNNSDAGCKLTTGDPTCNGCTDQDYVCG